MSTIKINVNNYADEYDCWQSIRIVDLRSSPAKKPVPKDFWHNINTFFAKFHYGINESGNYLVGNVKHVVEGRIEPVIDSFTPLTGGLIIDVEIDDTFWAAQPFIASKMVAKLVVETNKFCRNIMKKKGRRNFYRFSRTVAVIDGASPFDPELLPEDVVIERIDDRNGEVVSVAQQNRRRAAERRSDVIESPPAKIVKKEK